MKTKPFACKPFTRFYLFSCLGVIIASYYPLSMGARVIWDMISVGSVLKENYPKYIIPYTPICMAIIISVLLMPLCIKLLKKYALVGGATVGTGLFFAFELFFEYKVVVSSSQTFAKLADWQMFMCRYVSPEEAAEKVTFYKTETPVDILIGNYNPAFKLHFYIISAVLIITVLNCIYGFGQMAVNGEKKRLKSLVLQSVCSLAFLGFCILACFTAFWRDGSLSVSPLSATLMTVFFVLLGVTFGVFVGSFLLGKRKYLSVLLPSVVSSVMTLLMYIGEMILLNGHLYSFGSGFVFEGIPGIILAPIDLLIILFSGSLTALMFIWLNGKREENENTEEFKTGDNKKRKISPAIISVIGAAVVLALFICAVMIDNKNRSDIGGSERVVVNVGSVKIIEKTSNSDESVCLVEATVPGTDLSSPGKKLDDSIKNELEVYNKMTEEQKLISSKLWGAVDIFADTWEMAEEYIGFTVENSLEALDRLDKVSYNGSKNTPAPHVMISAYAMPRLSQVSVVAEYAAGDVRITLTATVYASPGRYNVGSVTNGYADYTQDTVITGSGISVLTVSIDALNNNGYYNAEYFDNTAYWVKGNVSYSLRVFGDKSKKTEIQALLNSILGDI